MSAGNKGIALIAAMVIMFLLSAFVGSLFFAVVNKRRTSERYYGNISALALAEAGMDYAMWELNSSNGDFLPEEGWSGTGPKVLAIADFKDADNNVYGDINISAYDTGTPQITVISEGVMDLPGGQTVTRRVKGLAKEKKLFNYAVQTSRTSGADTGGTPDCDADEEMPIVVIPRDIPATSNGALFLQSRETETVSSNRKYDSISMSGQSKLVIDGDVKIYVTSGITTTGSSQIIVNELCSLELYFGGSANIGGSGILNKSNDPSKLTLYGKPYDPYSQTSVSIAGNTNTYGTICAPDAAVSIGGTGDVYGAVIGKTVVLSNDVHYDERLRTDSPTLGYYLQYWQEK